MTLAEGPRTTSGVLLMSGVVPLEGRGELPFVDLRGEPLFLHAVRSLLAVAEVAGRVVVTAVPEQAELATASLGRAELAVPVEAASSWWSERTAAGGLVLVHDPLCPLTPVAFLERCLERGNKERAVVAFRPVTDTIKTVVGDRVLGTLDRDRFGVVSSPVAFAAPVDDPMVAPPTHDPAAMVGWLGERGDVELIEAPTLARRVEDSSAVAVLACLADLTGAVPRS